MRPLKERIRPYVAFASDALEFGPAHADELRAIGLTDCSRSRPTADPGNVLTM
jgi:hypothetical protein